MASSLLKPGRQPGVGKLEKDLLPKKAPGATLSSPKKTAAVPHLQPSAPPFHGSCHVTSGAGPSAGRGGVRAGSRGCSLRAERLTIYGQSWGRAAPGPRFRVGLSAAVARGAGAYGSRSRASDRPLRARHARRRLPRRPWARPLRGSTRARRRNKWARMPYEISECVGLRARPPASGVGCRREGAAGVLHGRPRGCGLGTGEWALWAGPAELREGFRDPTAAADDDREVRRPCPQAATGDRLGTPSADCPQLPGSREAGIAPSCTVPGLYLPREGVRQPPPGGAGRL